MANFRTALLNKLEETGTSLRKVAEDTGVSYEQLKKLKQIEGRSTNVEDALKIANYFGLTLDDFIAGQETKDRNDLAHLLEQLSPENRALLRTVAETHLASQSPESE